MKQNETIQIRVTPELKDKIEETARGLAVPVSVYIRSCVEQDISFEEIIDSIDQGKKA